MKHQIWKGHAEKYKEVLNILMNHQVCTFLIIKHDLHYMQSCWSNTNLLTYLMERENDKWVINCNNVIKCIDHEWYFTAGFVLWPILHLWLVFLPGLLTRSNNRTSNFCIPKVKPMSFSCQCENVIVGYFTGYFTVQLMSHYL